MNIKNSAKRERGQLRKRKHLGILEKKKDYRERSKDFKAKRELLAKLSEEARQRNPDEFSYAMINSKKNEDGSVVYVKPEEDEVKQSRRAAREKFHEHTYNYYVQKSTVDANKLEKLQGSLAKLDGEAANRHVVFVDSVQQVAAFDPATYFNTIPQLLDKPANRWTTEQLSADPLTDGDFFDSSRRLTSAVAQHAARTARKQKLDEHIVQSQRLRQAYHDKKVRSTLLLNKSKLINVPRKR